MSIFVNRTLNLKKIKAIGFDMDYTLVRYHTHIYERETFNIVKSRLIDLKNYPSEISQLDFKNDHCIRGLVLDKKRGNLLKLSLYGKVKIAYHGTKVLDFRAQQELYKGLVIDISLPEYVCIDSAFSIGHAVLFSMLVDLKDAQVTSGYPSYLEMCDDVEEMVDLIHRDGTLKSMVRHNIPKFIIQDPKCVKAIERFKKNGKQLFLITNSDFEYTKLLMNHCFTPYLEDHKNWWELFDLTVTLAQKPSFFTGHNNFLKVDLESGMMSNISGSLTPKKIYQGGNAEKLQRDFNLGGEEILYIGDHIFGDIVSLKRSCNWRTALVIEELDQELDSLKAGLDIQIEINQLMTGKEVLENDLDQFYAVEFEQGQEVEKKLIKDKLDQIQGLDQKISEKIKSYQALYNPHWGELMRAGQEESRFAGQVEKYACIYMSKISDFTSYSPRKYFRPPKRSLPHEELR